MSVGKDSESTDGSEVGSIDGTGNDRVGPTAASSGLECVGKPERMSETECSRLGSLSSRRLAEYEPDRDIDPASSGVSRHKPTRRSRSPVTACNTIRQVWIDAACVVAFDSREHGGDDCATGKTALQLAGVAVGERKANCGGN
ncbi:hypothetical protein CYV19_09530 [Natronobacterium gregoryi SP2]|uniref:Uncharacterized protein n=1 Tax=Natronobacterium gregoryi (strain ATCC 43098 / DSM 3393 / CCM 3738 / CIP 104747 / IAM 13177 / JCM 8860 / NBRC 102187 / NCIMB 2189 / SP2) TaxID=797304 RepID=L9Y4I1_NATGS|nr:hypothetical protein C490_09393 [Natronobacterium gregoryi SP2]PLK20464.1 hypothetical protein CYV19_09530 [Natronobacterium gregoryi SP2]